MIRSNIVRTIVGTGLLAGTLDGSAAVVNYLLVGGNDPTRVFLFIASGVFGRETVLANTGLWWWGVLFHYIIAAGWTVIYFLAYPKIKPLVRNKYLGGAAYGIIVWLLMNLVVVPLSRTPPIPLTMIGAMKGAGILIACIGIPVSFFAHRALAGEDS